MEEAGCTPTGVPCFSTELTVGLCSCITAGCCCTRPADRTLVNMGIRWQHIMLFVCR